MTLPCLALRQTLPPLKFGVHLEALLQPRQLVEDAVHLFRWSVCSVVTHVGVGSGNERKVDGERNMTVVKAGGGGDPQSVPSPPQPTNKHPPTHLDIPRVGGVGKLGQLPHHRALLPRVDERGAPHPVRCGLPEGPVPVCLFVFWGVGLVGGGGRGGWLAPCVCVFVCVLVVLGEGFVFWGGSWGWFVKWEVRRLVGPPGLFLWGVGLVVLGGGGWGSLFPGWLGKRKKQQDEKAIIDD